MYKFLLIASLFFSIAAFANVPKTLSELLDLVAKEHKEFEIKENSDEADTQVEMNDVASGYEKMCLRHFYLFFDFKLRNAKTFEERVNIIKEFEEIIKAVDRLNDYYLKNDFGSSGGMMLAYMRSNLYNYQQIVWQFLPDKAELWNKIKDVSFPLEKKGFRECLNNGRAVYSDVCYDDEYLFAGEIVLNSLFIYQDRMFFVLGVDLYGGSVNNDFIRYYLCEVKGDTVIKKVELKDFIFGQLEIAKDTVYLVGCNIENMDETVTIRVNLKEF